MLEILLKTNLTDGTDALQYSKKCIRATGLSEMHPFSFFSVPQFPTHKLRATAG